MFVINSNNHFFEIKDGITLDLSRLVGCEIVANRAQMYESVIATTGQDLDEILDQELIVRRNHEDDLVCIDARGMVDHLCNTNDYQRGGLEEYLSDWEL